MPCSRAPPSRSSSCSALPSLPHGSGMPQQFAGGYATPAIPTPDPARIPMAPATVPPASESATIPHRCCHRVTVVAAAPASLADPRPIPPASLPPVPPVARRARGSPPAPYERSPARHPQQSSVASLGRTAAVEQPTATPRSYRRAPRRGRPASAAGGTANPSASPHPSAPVAPAPASSIRLPMTGPASPAYVVPSNGRSARRWTGARTEGRSRRSRTPPNARAGRDQADRRPLGFPGEGAC